MDRLLNLSNARQPRSRLRAFSLVEMLTVLAIIVIVLGILIPVLSKARNTARKTATLTLMDQLGKAVAQFQLDQGGKLPGYFSQKDMGDTENSTTYGFTNLENMLLDLVGGIVNASSGDLGDGDVSHSAAAGGPRVIQVGPKTLDAAKTTRVYLDIGKMGSPTQTATGTLSRGYFKIDSKSFVSQASKEGSRLNMPASSTGAPGYFAMPTIIDTFGQPILAWAANEAAGASSDFAAENSSKSARFYWASNAGFLRATALGKRGENQITDSIVSGGPGAGDTGARVNTIEAICGNPAFPAVRARPIDPFKPKSPRGPVVFHSAGPSGEYLGRDTRGAKLAGSATGMGPTDATLFVPYRPAGAANQPNPDLITNGAFDDIFLPAGNN